MERAVSLAPDRIAYFGYAHVPWMKKHMTLLPEDALPDADARLDQQEAGADFLTGAGFTAIGIDHFVRPGDEMQQAFAAGRLRRNFQGYTTDRADALVGFGASAIGECAAGFSQNAADTKTYFDRVSAGDFATRRVLELLPEDRPRKRIIEKLMCDMAVDVAAVCAEYGLSPDAFDAELETLAPMAADGIVTLSGRRVVIDPAFRILARIVCETFDQYARPAQETGPRHAQAV